MDDVGEDGRQGQAVGDGLRRNEDVLGPQHAGERALRRGRGGKDDRAVQQGQASVAAPLDLEQVGVADEVGGEAGHWAGIDVLATADLLDAAAVHQHDPVRHAHRLVLVVRHEQEGDAEPVLDLLELALDLPAQLEVERAQRLVEQQQLWPVDDGPRQRHALLLAAGKLGRQTLTEAGEADELQSLARALRCLVLWRALPARPIGHVLRHAHMWEEGVVLEHRVERAPIGRQPRHILAREPDRAGLRRQEAGDAAQQRGLAAARWSQQSDELALLDGEVDRREGRLSAEMLGQAVNGEDGGAHRAARDARGRSLTCGRSRGSRRRRPASAAR